MEMDNPATMAPSQKSPTIPGLPSLPPPSPSPGSATESPSPQRARAGPSHAPPIADHPVPRRPSGLEVWRSPCVLTLHLDLVDPLQDALLHVLRHRRVIEVPRHFSPVLDRPFQELHYLLSFCGVLLLLVNQKPRVAANHVVFFSLSICHRETQVVRIC